MILLVTHGHPTIKRYGGDVGRLVQPRHYSDVSATAHEGYTWAADNDYFRDKGAATPQAELDELAAALRRMLAAIDGLPGCRFVTVPDVVGDHDATLARWQRWAPEVGAIAPPAFAIQDGCTVELVPWDEAGAIFVGGGNAFKLGEDAAVIVAEANRRGLWAHMGRVNSMERIAYAGSIGCDSVDGTSWVRWERRWMRRGANAALAAGQARLVP